MSKFVTGFIAGIAAGISLSVFSRTARGQQVLTNLRDNVNDATYNLKLKLDSLNEKVNSLIVESNQEVNNEFFDKLSEE